MGVVWGGLGVSSGVCSRGTRRLAVGTVEMVELVRGN